MSLTKFLYLYPFAYTIDVSIEGKCKDLQRQGKVHHVFCLGDIVCIKLFENGSPAKVHHISDIPNFPSDLDIEN